MHKVLLYILICISLSAQGQRFCFEINTEAEKVYVDELGNIYLKQSTILKKYDKVGTELFSFSHPQFLEITIVDVSDPLRIMIYFKESNELYYLNRQLSPIASPVMLDDLEFYTPLAICSSALGGFWLMDAGKRQIHHINTHLETDINTISLDLLTDSNQGNLRLIEKNNRIFVHFIHKQIIIFNDSGIYESKISSAFPEEIYLQDHSIHFYQNGKISTYDIRNFLESSSSFEFCNQAKSVVFSGSKIYCLKNKQLEVYQIE